MLYLVFPSPIYGASFKHLLSDSQWIEEWDEFPSPIYGASFKRRFTSSSRSRILKFPSPIYGASFKQVKVLWVSRHFLNKFLSVIYGASFKLSTYGQLLIIGRKRFRPLYTGLVSNFTYAKK